MFWERQHGDRRLFGQCWQRLRQFLITRLARDGLFAEQDAIDAHRPRYVLDPLLAHVVEHELELVAHLVAYYTADADPARLGQGFETCGDVNAIPENVVTLHDDVTEIDADTERDTLIGGDADISPCHLPLHFDSAAHRVDDAGKLRKIAVASVFHDPAVVLGYFRLDQLLEMRRQAFVRAFLVHSHQARIPRHIGGENCGETAGCCHPRGTLFFRGFR